MEGFVSGFLLVYWKSIVAKVSSARRHKGEDLIAEQMTLNVGP
jgi:hypothetical protein